MWKKKTDVKTELVTEEVIREVTRKLARSWNAKKKADDDEICCLNCEFPIHQGEKAVIVRNKRGSILAIHCSTHCNDEYVLSKIKEKNELLQGL